MEPNETADGLAELVPHMGDLPVTSPNAIAAIAMQMALKYHDTGTIKDGAMYQQYKLEGRNMRELHLDMVFETAIKIEEHLLLSQRRIADMMMDIMQEVIDHVSDETSADEPA